MKTADEIAYYSRQVLLDEIGLLGQKKLSDARVLVIGAGGLGCPVLQYLAAAGVGTIGIVDGDVVDVSNLHRQILFGFDSIGKGKSEEARNTLIARNPFIAIHSYPFHLTTENAIETIEKYDIVVDCTDNYEARFLVNDACVLCNKPLVYGSIYRFEGQVSVFNLNDGPTYRCLYPEMPSEESITNCSEAGVIGVLPGIIGLLQANEVIKLITSYGNVLSGKILVFSAQNNSFDLFKLKRNELFDYGKLIQNGKLIAENYLRACSSDFEMNIDIEELLKGAGTDEFLILDVRGENELPLFVAEGVLQIPLDELNDKLVDLPTSRKIAVICKSGNRSRKAIKIIKNALGEVELRNVENGITLEFINAWKEKKKQLKVASEREQ